MIALEVPVEKIPYIRTIEGRKFRNGKWLFPESSSIVLKQVGLLDEDYETPKQENIQYDVSHFLYNYQKNVVNEALNHEGYGIFMETGCGKTLCGLEIAKCLGKTLILCPLSVIETAWIDDCHKFYPNLRIINCWGTNQKQRYEALMTDNDVYVMNYETFKILKNSICKMKFQCMIVDESSIMKNMKSQITSEILSMINIIPRRYVLSGTPNPNSNLELFPQIKFALPDLFGNNYYGWQATYFHQDMQNPHIWYQTEEDKDRLFQRLSEGAVFIRKEDCAELPPKVFMIRQYQLKKKQCQYYDDVLNDIKSHINEWTKFEFTAKIMKLREITSGFLINKDKSIIDFDTGKDKVLEQIFEEIENKSVIVWCQFQYEIERLAEKYNGVALTSKTSNRDKIIRDFKENKIKRLFTHPKLLGKGLTFVNCTYCIYYSYSFSYEEFKQSQDRIHRIGQKNKCTYFVLQGKETKDKAIYNCLQRKSNVVDELYREIGLKTKE